MRTSPSNEITPQRPKFIAALSFRGFEMRPEEVESLVGVEASTLIRRGSTHKPGAQPFQRSVARWEIEFPDSTRLDEMIPALLDSIGGFDHLVVVKKRVAPEFFEIDLSLWIKDSGEQEGGFIDASTIALVAQLGATLSFAFYSRNDA